LLPFVWLLALLIWAVFQVGEVLPRTGFWDFTTKVQIMNSLQGAGVTIKPKGAGQQTDLVYWQETVINDAKMRRGLFFTVSLMAHAADIGMLWPGLSNARCGLAPDREKHHHHRISGVQL
jgi:hypothetical protein